MAAWYGVFQGKPLFKVFDITQYGNNSNVKLQLFWLTLLTEANGCTVYCHNWAGYDVILSMASLVSLHELGYSFNPILQKGKVICVKILLGNKVGINY